MGGLQEGPPGALSMIGGRLKQHSVLLGLPAPPSPLLILGREIEETWERKDLITSLEVSGGLLFRIKNKPVRLTHYLWRTRRAKKE